MAAALYLQLGSAQGPGPRRALPRAAAPPPPKLPPRRHRAGALSVAAAPDAAAALEEKRARRREHQRRQRQRAKERHVADLTRIIGSLGPPGGPGATWASSLDDVASAYVQRGRGGRGVDWARVPPACDPQRGGGLGRGLDNQRHGHGPSPRAARKVESFALVLRALLDGAAGAGAGPGKGGQFTVVDFGCGGGNLVLPLAHLFPEATFWAVDIKEQAVARVVARAEDAGLPNVRPHVGAIEDFDHGFDVALALHACGRASDEAQAQAVTRGAAYALCPCCVGKLNLGLRCSIALAGEDGDVGGIAHPRSAWMRAALRAGDFAALARAGDIGHGTVQEDEAEERKHGHPSLARLAKLQVELDRSEWAREAGYRTAVLRLLAPEITAKTELLCGVPRGWGPTPLL